MYRIRQFSAVSVHVDEVLLLLNMVFHPGEEIWLIHNLAPRELSGYGIKEKVPSTLF
jgi:hypothetical protein